MNHRWKGIGVISTGLLISTAVVLFLSRSGDQDRALDVREYENQQTKSSGNLRNIDILIKSDEVESGSVASSTLTLHSRQIQDGDVISHWGDFVVFKNIAKNCAYVTRELRRGNEVSFEDEWHCESETVADHPYGMLDNSQLEQIASTDGVAALILGLRLKSQAKEIEEYQEAIRYLHSSVLLTGESQAYETLMEQQDILLGVRYLNGRPESTANANSYVWAKAGQRLGLVDQEKVLRIRNGVIADDSLNLESLDTMAADLAQQFNEQRQSLIGEIFK